MNNFPASLGTYCCSVAKLCLTLWPAAHQTSLSFTISQSFPKFTSNEAVMQSNHSPSLLTFVLLPLVFPALGSFPMSQLFVSGGQSIGASALASVLPQNIQGWFPLELTSLIMSDSLWPHRWQPTRLLHPWDFPGKSTGVGCHCLLRLRNIPEKGASPFSSQQVYGSAE